MQKYLGYNIYPTTGEGFRYFTYGINTPRIRAESLEAIHKLIDQDRKV